METVFSVNENFLCQLVHKFILGKCIYLRHTGYSLARPPISSKSAPIWKRLVTYGTNMGTGT
jgi:hypothetical protein